MCFYIPEKGKNSKEQIADKNIICYKRVNRGRSGCYVPRLYPECKTRYRLGKVAKVKSFGIDGNGIGRGLHSEVKYSRTDIYLSKREGSNHVIIECIIPKGTKYYKSGKYKVYVSLAIKPIREI